MLARPTDQSGLAFLPPALEGYLAHHEGGPRVRHLFARRLAFTNPGTWTLRTTASQHGLVVVHAGDRGCYAMASGPEPGAVAFRAISSYDVWLRLQELVAEAGAAD